MSKKIFKTLTLDKIKKLQKDELEQLYSEALNLYPDSGGGQISRRERQNLYYLQEALFGKLDEKLKSSLENIGETLVKKPKVRKKAINYSLPTSGAVIVKDWKGKQLEVKIIESGFEYEGKAYKSLSKLAKEIAGYAVSGPIFFGLRKARLPLS